MPDRSATKDVVHEARKDLVRKYRENPRLWPDGLDLPHWKEPHELWFTGHEQYWYDLLDKAEAPPPISVTRVTETTDASRKVGRPAKEGALSDAERARRYREQRKNAARAAMAMLGAPDVNAKKK